MPKRRKLIIDVSAPARQPSIRRVKRHVVIEPLASATQISEKVAWARRVHKLKTHPIDQVKVSQQTSNHIANSRGKTLNQIKHHKRHPKKSQTLRRVMPNPLNSRNYQSLRITKARIASRLLVGKIVVLRNTRRRKLSLLALPASAVLLFAVGVGFLWNTQKQTDFVEQVAAVTAESGSQGRQGPEADETPPPDISSYQVAPDMPRVLRIPSLAVEARVMPMGILPSGELEAPFNIHDAGWYNQSSKPGKHGAMLIDGHVHGPSVPGIFNKLKDLPDGATVEVERGDGRKFTYKVVGRDITPKAETNMNKALVSAQRGTPGLNLITCTGDYNHQGDYEERMVVYTVLQ